MNRRLVRLPRDGRPILDIHSLGRGGFPGAGGFSRAQIDQIRGTVRRVPEVMVKVTGGGTKVGAVKAHLDYISRKGALEIETDTGDRIARDQQKAFLADW